MDSSGLGGSTEELDGGVDTSVEGDASADSGAIDLDSEVVDTTVPPDTAPTDTNLPDTAMPDTAMPDTRPPDAGCTLTTCGTACVNTANDMNNCGGCGKVCSSLVKYSVACASGSCACKTGEAVCGGECTVTREGSKDCGGCGVSCAPDEYCRAGGCTCRPGLTKCGTSCVNTTSDVANCGSCGNLCSGGTKACAGSACVAACPSGTTACASGGGTNSCVNVLNDPTNCGACGKVCSVDEVCVAGTCEKYAPAPSCSTCPCAACTTIFPSGRCCPALSGHSFPSCVDATGCPG